MLETIIPEMERTTGAAIERLLADAGYRGHNASSSHRFRVFTAGQKRRVTPAIKREMRRRAASPKPKATPSTPSWPPQATTSPSSSNG